MKKSYVVTGDVVGFTTLSDEERRKLLIKNAELLKTWADKPANAGIFRGDSFQVLFESMGTAIKRSVQLRCWLKMRSKDDKHLLDGRIVIGVGTVAYHGKNVLESDGEAFHLSGRLFDKLGDDERLKIVTNNERYNAQLDVICELAEVIMRDWTINQSEVIFLSLEGLTQHQMAMELNIGQSAVNNRLKLARWKQIEKMILYIESLID